jgi:hypothetical protein
MLTLDYWLMCPSINLDCWLMCPSMLEHITFQTFHKICVINIVVQYYLSTINHINYLCIIHYFTIF